MKHTEAEIRNLKNHHVEMWNLVESQVRKAFDSLRNFDTQKAREIIAREKVVNAQELVVDHHLENFIALFAPVAVDLRLVISMLKINNNLERIGDFAESIAQFVLYKQNAAIDVELFKNLHLEDMMSTIEDMFSISRKALMNEDTEMAACVFGLDTKVDEINTNSVNIIADYMIAHPESAIETLGLHTVVRKIERIGDRINNIAEDVVFLVDAKEMRHVNKDNR